MLATKCINRPESANITQQDRNFEIVCPWDFLQEKQEVGLSDLKD